MFRNKGFTLIELLVVVAILSVMSGIAISTFMGARTKSLVTSSLADMNHLAQALELYYLDTNGYPAVAMATTKLCPDYLSDWPRDRFNANASRITGPPWTNYKPKAMIEKGYGYALTGHSCWLLLSNGPDNTPSITTVTTWVPLVSGVLGGKYGAYEGYGYNNAGGQYWYNPISGDRSGGDLGRGGP